MSTPHSVSITGIYYVSDTEHRGRNQAQLMEKGEHRGKDKIKVGSSTRPGPSHSPSLGLDLEEIPVVSTERQEHLKVTPSQIIYSFRKYFLPSLKSNNDARKPNWVLSLPRTFENTQIIPSAALYSRVSIKWLMGT